MSLRRVVLVGAMAAMLIGAFGGSTGVMARPDFFYTSGITLTDSSGVHDGTFVGSCHRAVNYNSQDYFLGLWTIELYCPEASPATVVFYDLYENPDGTTAIRDSLVRELPGLADYCDIGWGDCVRIWLRIGVVDSGQVTAIGTESRDIYGN